MNLVRHEEMRRIDAKMRRHPAPVFGNRVRIVLRADAAVKRCVNSSGDAAQPGEKSMGQARRVKNACAERRRGLLHHGDAVSKPGGTPRPGLVTASALKSLAMSVAPEPWPPPARRRTAASIAAL